MSGAKERVEQAVSGEEVLFANYRRAPVAFTRGEGIRLWDREGRSYLDFLAGIATSSLGHAHPRLLEAIRKQAGRVLHVSNLYRVPEQEEAARRLVAGAASTGGAALERVFFCNSGAEANEAAIKLARKWGSSRDGRNEIVVTENGFHGRTLGALAATGTPAYHRGFEPLPGGFVHVPFNDLDAARRVVSERTCAVLVEPVQGEGGVHPATPEYLKGLEALCAERSLLFLLDEVQTGIGRTGSLFGFQHYGVHPDAVTLAKGLGGGVPVGAVLARTEVAACFQPGDHGSTFGGNPLASAAVTAVLDAIEEEGLLERVTAAGAALRGGLERLRAAGRIEEVRGCGLMLAAQVPCDAGPLVSRCLELGLLVGAVGPKAIRMLPPLIIRPAEIDKGLEILGRALDEVGSAS